MVIKQGRRRREREKGLSQSKPNERRWQHLLIRIICFSCLCLKKEEKLRERKCRYTCLPDNRMLKKSFAFCLHSSSRYRQTKVN